MAVGVISKVFRILEAIEASPSGLGLKSICDATRLNKSTAHRFLKHLEREGYLIRADGGKYLIGPKLSQMGARADHRATLAGCFAADLVGTLEIDARDGEFGDAGPGQRSVHRSSGESARVQALFASGKPAFAACHRAGQGSCRVSARDAPRTNPRAD